MKAARKGVRRATARVELVAEPRWVESLESAAREASLSKSAYIRVAVDAYIRAARKGVKP